ncbi:hypothetical protein C8R47DRAFT_404659 [Mycena vitilis]|nr:hypothetical protein C8R47DRAFT_404659 [Mycena vitilis]
MSCISTASTASSPRAGRVRVYMQYEQRWAYFYMKKETVFETPMKMFAQKINHEPGLLRFQYAGTRVRDSDTPVTLGMDDQVEQNLIDVHLMQLGG